MIRRISGFLSGSIILNHNFPILSYPQARFIFTVEQRIYSCAYENLQRD